MTTSPAPAGQLPVAEPSLVRRAAVRLMRLDWRALTVVIGLNVLAAGAALASPWLLGRIIDEVRAGAGVGTVDRLALAILGFALAQFLLVRLARNVGHRFGERTLARVREQFIDRALKLRSSVVERAGTGDLTARGTADVDLVGVTLRDAAPEVFIAGSQALLLFSAIFLLDPILGGCAVVGLLGICVALRWYLRRARNAYLAAGATTSALAEILAATASGARTVEAFGLQRRRIMACQDAIEKSRQAQNRTLFLRSVLFPAVDISYAVPVVVVLVVGGVLHSQGTVSLGTVVTASLYLRQLSQPLDTILLWVEQLQSSGAAFARVEGLAQATRTPPTTTPVPADNHIAASNVYYAYDGGPDVLDGINLTVRPGERLAVVGPSGAGKSTLGRLLAGIDQPRHGMVTVGGVQVADLSPDQLRRHIVLVTQEHHVFLGTVRDNLLIAAPAATDTELHVALAVVGAEWINELPDHLDTEISDGQHRLDTARAQQAALARVVLADPHTVILDEATALLDPRTARHTERALAAVLRGRTVIAIAHRLHTAEDADRVAVMDAGRLTELGTHDELIAADATYAALWHSWHGE